MPNTHCRFIFDLEVKQILHRVISFKFYQQRFSFVHCISYASIVSQHRLFWTKAFLQGLLYGTLKFHFINISLLKQWSQFLGWRLFCSCINHSPLLVLCYQICQELKTLTLLVNVISTNRGKMIHVHG